jgi:hypothetical protein
MINEKEFLVNNNMEVIFVKDKYEVVEAAELLESIGIIVFKDFETPKDYLESDKAVKNNYMAYDDDGWRIQSHFISDDMDIVALRKGIKNVLSHSDFTHDMELEAILKELADVGDRIYRLKKKVIKLRKAQ